MQKISIAVVMVLALGAGCGDGDDDDDDTDATPDMTAGDGSDDAAQTPVERGEYLVKHVLVCGDCHTPRNDMGMPIEDEFLGGSPTFADLNPAANMGNVPAPNLTPHATGLGDWTDAQIKTAFTEGEDKDGMPLWDAMPYWMFHNLTDDDADAIVAYLKSIPPVDNDVGEREALPFPVTKATPLPMSLLPDTTLAASDANYAKAVQGKYIAAIVCVDCHTAPKMGGTYPIDEAKLLAGGRTFNGADFGPPDSLPEDIYARNITPHATGIMGWTAAAVATTLHLGIDKDGIPICPPMPVGTAAAPMVGFGGMTDDDAEAVGWYVTTIPPVDSLTPGVEYPECPAPP